MELNKITEECYFFHSPVNVGYIRKGSTGILIDAGLDSSASKKVIRQLDERNWPLTHLLITHAHADHFGGAYKILTKRKIITLAPEVEADVLRYPKWEPIYLFQGNEPHESLRNKFIEGQAVQVDEYCHEGPIELGEISIECVSLPGHAENQMGVIYEGILFAADAYMSIETLNKHRIPYLVDLGRTLDSLKKMLELPVRGAVPGHGIFEESFKETIQDNIQFHEDILSRIANILKDESNGLSHEQMIQKVCQEWNIELKALPQWALYRTAITSYLHYLAQTGRVNMFIKQNMLWFIHK
ncbi:MBL fold metallo-hydrolase [Scopulibacillus cellulosilyticus]|uniref:MBL fold metallo-hydrolase n=1 Tax=Scopulibacillus cellulosilyticus TaxID=2665665 RepID=A0ABW2Q038_9BACL